MLDGGLWMPNANDIICHVLWLHLTGECEPLDWVVNGDMETLYSIPRVLHKGLILIVSIFFPFSFGT